MMYNEEAKIIYRNYNIMHRYFRFFAMSLFLVFRTQILPLTLRAGPCDVKQSTEKLKGVDFVDIYSF